MGAGKTTVGRELAAQLGLNPIDTDHFIERRYHRTISQLFADGGEDRFRKIEAAALNEIADLEDVVVSTGGGAPCFYDNMQRMNDAGITVYLKASPEALADRLKTGKNSRPLVKNKSKDELKAFIAEMLAQREAFYNRATIILETERITTPADVQQIVRQLIEQLRRPS
jgi:shikimate kinase